MLSDHRIKLLDRDLFGSGPLVLGGRVEVPRSGRGHQPDFVTHETILRLCSDLPALGPKIFQNSIDTLLIDDSQTLVGYAQTDPSIFTFDPEPPVMDVWLEHAFGPVVGV